MLNPSYGEGRNVEHCSNLEINFLTLRLFTHSISLFNSLYTLLHASIDLFLIATYTHVLYYYVLRLVLVH